MTATCGCDGGASSRSTVALARARRERPAGMPIDVPQAERCRAAAIADAAAVQGHAARGHRAAVPQRVLGQPARPASTSTSSPASRCSARSTSSTPAPAGRASPGRSSRATSRDEGRPAAVPRAPRCARRTPTRTSATSSTTARRRPGMRYCMNSAALRFIPVERLEAEGYAQYLPLFEKQATVPEAVTKP